MLLSQNYNFLGGEWYDPPNSPNYQNQLVFCLNATIRFCSLFFLASRLYIGFSWWIKEFGSAQPARPAQAALPDPRWFPDDSRMIPGWLLDNTGIRIEPGPFQQTPGGTNEAKDITKTIEIIVSFGWMYRIREMQKSWNTYTYKYCYFYDFCCFQKKHILFICFNVIIWCAGIFAGDRWQNQKNVIPDNFRSMLFGGFFFPG